MNNRVEVGRVVRRTFQIYGDQVSVLIPAAAVVFVISGILSALLIAAAPILAILAIVISVLASTLFTGMVVELVADVQDGRRDATVGQLLRAVTPVLGQLILVGIVAGIGIAIGFILIVIPGLILLTIWSVAAPVVVLERPGGLRALARSRELVRGNGWNVFGVIVVLVILVVVASGVIEAIADSGGTAIGLIVRVIVGILTAPISALAAAVLYFELGGSARGQLPDGDGSGSGAGFGSNAGPGGGPIAPTYPSTSGPGGGPSEPTYPSASGPGAVPSEPTYPSASAGGTGPTPPTPPTPPASAPPTPPPPA